MDFELDVNPEGPAPPPSDFSAGYTLGLDLGSNSIGWAIVSLDPSTGDLRGLRTGVRIFSGGTEIEKGNEKSRALDRRMARQQRRQLERRVRRRRKLARILCAAGLLPEIVPPETTHWDNNPYRLRAKGLSEALTPHELGRALYHLGKRRGFKSSRKEAASDDKELGPVKEGMSETKRLVEESGLETLGAYLQSLNPHEQRLRGRYVARTMVEQEFADLWAAQQPHHPETLTPEFKEQVYHAIFWQRPLKSVESRIGRCELEPDEPRAPKWAWEVHQFRVLQEIANIRVLNRQAGVRNLTQAERELLLAECAQKEKVEFEKVRKQWIKKRLLTDADTFNLEAGFREEMMGNVVEVGLSKAYKHRWATDADLLRKTIWPAFQELEDDVFDDQARANGWNTAEDELKAMAKMRAGQGYSRFSLKAISQLLPHLEAGANLHDALEVQYPNRGAVEVSLDRLPAVGTGGIANPVVTRTLSETRKLVNALIGKFGKPARIVLEMTRETKGSIEQRAKQAAQNWRNRKERETIRQRLLEQGVDPTADAILRYRLWEECGGGPAGTGSCPYTGKAMAFHDVFGPTPSFQIEHIQPYSVTFDDNYTNLTLSHRDANIEKGNRTPWQAWGTNKTRFEEITQRVHHMEDAIKDFQKRRHFRAKRLRITSREELDPAKFLSRQLNDTSYATREARRFLQQLGVPVDTTRGQVTAELRYLWGMNSILNEPVPAGTLPDAKPAKNRNDHRHHAIDALVIAMTNAQRIHQFSSRWVCPDSDARKRAIAEPWPRFRHTVEQSVAGINVSHRPEHKISGAFSKETSYGTRTTDKETRYVRRVDVPRLTSSMMERICDPVVRRTIEAALQRHGCDASKLTAEQLADLRMPCKNGLGPQIKRVRVWESLTNPIPIKRDDGEAFRFLASGNNHHLTIFRHEANTGKKTAIKNLAWVTTLFECYQRVGSARPVITREHPEFPNARYLMHLTKGDLVLWDEPGTESTLFKVTGISGPPTSAALEIMLIQASKSRSQPAGGETEADLRKRDMASGLVKRLRSLPDGKLPFRKVTVDLLGEIHDCND